MTKSDRAEQLRAEVPSTYSGYLHLVFIHLTAFGGIGLCLAALDHPSVWEWMVVPVFFVFSNWFEWWVHRGPLHKPTPGLYLAYKRHTLEHHVVYTEDDMDLRGASDLKLVLFPPWVLPSILIANLPIPLLFVWLGTPNLAYLFYASALAYYMV